MKNKNFLEIKDLKARLEKFFIKIDKETSVISVAEKNSEEESKNQMEKTQREYYLNEQLKAIQKELGEIDEGKDEVSKSLTKGYFKKQKCLKPVQEKCLSELKKTKVNESYVC